MDHYITIDLGGHLSHLDHFITIVGNEKVETLPLMTFDLRGHLRSLLRSFIFKSVI